MQVTKQIAVELLDGGNVPPIVYAKQNDRQTRFVAASLYENGQPFEPPDGVLAEFRARKPDGTACFYDVNEDGEPAIVIEGSVVTAELVEQVLTAAGKVYAEINLYSSAGEKLTTFSFVIIVEPSVLTDAEIVSSDYYNILSAQIKAAQDAAQTAQTAAQKAQSYAGQAEETLQEVEQLADTVSGTIQQTGQEQVAAVQQAGQAQVSSVTQAGQEQITAVQQAGAQQTAAAAAEADRAKGYADSIDPSQFVKTVNGEEPDSNGNVEVQAGVASVFGRTGAVTAQAGDYNAGQIEETASRVFVSPEQKTKIDTAYSTSSGPLPIENGGTEADNAETARENLDVPQKVNVLGHNTQFNYTTYNGGYANDITREFHEFVFNMKNIPSSDSGYGFLDVSTTNGSGFAPSPQGVILQKFYGYSSGRMFYRTRRNGTTWSNWLCPFPFSGTYSGTGASSGSEQTISLGFRPRFLIVKQIGATSHWWADNSSGDQYVEITDTGFRAWATASTRGKNYRYAAWR